VWGGAVPLQQKKIGILGLKIVSFGTFWVVFLQTVTVSLHRMVSLCSSKTINLLQMGDCDHRANKNDTFLRCSVMCVAAKESRPKWSRKKSKVAQLATYREHQFFSRE